MTSSTEGGARPKVIYVMGAGRSGSSILGVCLGNCGGVFYAGELDKWLLREGVPSRKKDLRRLRFWEQVLARVERPETVFGRESHNNLERSSALFRPGRPGAARRLRPDYLRVSEAVYRAIAEVSGEAVIVDSSHYPLRARELQRLEGVELHLLLLVRDAQEIVASFDRDDVDEPRFGEAKTNLYLWLTYALSAGTFLRQPAARRMLVRHEDLLAEPERVLREILDRVGSSAALPDLDALEIGTPLHGNRLLAAERVALHRQPRGRRTRTRWLTALMQLPFTALFSRLEPAVAKTDRRHSAPV
jgi:hypothetical protein